MQYVPQDGVYVYFRYNTKQTILCVMNTNDGEKEIDLQRFIERTKGFTQAKNIVDGSVSDLTSTLKIPGKTVLVAELR